MKRLRTLLALLVPSTLGATAVLVLAGSALATCGQAKITLYEDAHGANDQISFCTTGGSSGNKPNLGNVAHTQSGSCNAPVKIGDNWNDCVSSFRITLASGYCISTYKDSNYGGAWSEFATAQSGFLYFANPNDSMSSIRFGVKNGSGSCVYYA